MAYVYGGFHRTVSYKKTSKGTRYEHIAWWSGKTDVVLDGVMFKGLSEKEYNYFFFNF